MTRSQKTVIGISMLVIVTVLMLAIRAGSTTYYSPTPMPKAQFFDNSGRPLSGGKIYTYVPGTTTPMTTYSNAAGTVPNANPVILDSAGRASIFLNGYYDISVYTSAGALIYSAAYVGNPATATTGATLFSQWNPTGLTPTRTSNTTFSVVGDKLSIFPLGIRIKSDNTTGLVYSTVSQASYGGGVTTVTVINDDLPLDSGMSAVSTSILTPADNGLPIVPVTTKTGSYVVTSEDYNKVIVFGPLSASATITFPTPTTIPNGSFIITKNTSTWPLTVSGTIDNTLNPAILYQGEAVKLLSTGTATWQVISQNTTSHANIVSSGTNTWSGTNTFTGPVSFLTNMVTGLPLSTLVTIYSNTAWTVPAGVSKVYLFGSGGGGGGGGGSTNTGAGGGGGRGGFIKWYPLSVTPYSTLTITIGAGGGGGAAGGSTGTTGTSTTIAGPITITLEGGVGGAPGSSTGLGGVVGTVAASEMGTVPSYNPSFDWSDGPFSDGPKYLYQSGGSGSIGTGDKNGGYGGGFGGGRGGFAGTLACNAGTSNTGSGGGGGGSTVGNQYAGCGGGSGYVLIFY